MPKLIPSALLPAVYAATCAPQLFKINPNEPPRGGLQMKGSKSVGVRMAGNHECESESRKLSVQFSKRVKFTVSKELPNPNCVALFPLTPVPAFWLVSMQNPSTRWRLWRLTTPLQVTVVLRVFISADTNLVHVRSAPVPHCPDYAQPSMLHPLETPNSVQNLASAKFRPSFTESMWAKSKVREER
ncbi:hypothetical protein B0H14DRAFT_2574923 [Mycena olivaceomarginata]|nr:hypothetical protein B0H14DRAFT_2574923 [Mycena olivaceomarginata]